MELEDYRKLRNELEKDYFLIGRRAFFSGFIACLVIVAGVGWTSVRTTLSKYAEGVVMSRLEEGQRVANELINGSSAVPLGAIILIDNNRSCPENYVRISNFGVLILTDPNFITDDIISRTQSVTAESRHRDEDVEFWDRRQFRACLFDERPNQ